jgi:hypothetical protein
MGTQGVLWDVPKLEICEALKRNKGRLVATAKELNCCFTTLDKNIKKDQELVELVAELRRWGGHGRVDKAEDILDKAMCNADQDIRTALSAAFYTLNTDDMAKERGWGNKLKEDANQPSLDQTVLLQKQNFELQAKLQACHSALQAAGVQIPASLDKSQSDGQARS